MVKLSEYIIDFISKKGNDNIFGIQGVPNLPLYVSAYEKGLNIINNTSENYSIYSSLGMYESTKLMQFVILTVGPGILGGLKALGNAYTNEIPLFLITPYNRDSTDNFGEHHSVGDGNDEINTLEILKNFTSISILLKDVNNIDGILNKAYDYALQHKKPVNISIPYDYFDLDVNVNNNINVIDIDKVNINKSVLIIGEDFPVENLNNIIDNKIPYFIIGNNIKNYMLSDYYLGTLTYSQNKVINLLVEKNVIENIFIFNVKGNYYNIGFLDKISKKINVHHYIENDIDKCYYFFGKNINYNFYLKNEFNISLFNNFEEKYKSLILKCNQVFLKQQEKSFYLDFSTIINDKINDSNIFISVGGYENWGKKYLNNVTNNYFYPSQYLDMGQMIKSLGYRDNANKNNIIITGDGNFLMNLGELNTILNLGLKTSIILLNNNGYGSLYDNFSILNKGKKYLNREPFNIYKEKVDFEKIAEAFKFNYHLLSNEMVGFGDINFKKNNLIEIVID